MKNIGTGANGSITKIRYNKNKKKILITGEFSEFNGIPAQSVVMLNDDGTRDEIFQDRKKWKEDWQILPVCLIMIILLFQVRLRNTMV